MIRCTSRQLSKKKYSPGLVSLYFPSKSIPYTKFESILLAMRYSKQLQLNTVGSSGISNNDYE